MVAIIMALLFAVSSAAQATVAKALDFDELVKQSDVVVHGWVVEQWSEAPDGLPGIIYTYTVIEVTSALKGISTNRLQLRQIGGKLDGYSVHLSGTPHFHLGTEVIVFAGRDDDDSPYASTGLAQGVFHVKRHNDDVRVVRDLSGITFHDPVVRTFSKTPMPDRLPALIDHVLDRWSDQILKEGE